MTYDAVRHYLQLLEHPPANAKNYTRWWWYGAAVTPEEIDRQLQYMYQAELGGVEIQITYPMQEDRPGQGIEHQDFFSPRFFELLDYTLRKADELGLWVDLTLGSGWPFGGPFVPFEMAPEVLIPYQIDIIGPTVYEKDFTTILPGQPFKAVLGKFENGKLLESTLRDVTDRIQDTWLYNWQWGYRMDSIDIPEGQWKLYLFVVNIYKQTVGKPSPGMEGYAIDHCRADVSSFYFRNFGDPIVDRLGEGRIRTFFCDSIELGGNNWTPIMLDEFKRRRGYDLSRYMPALWGDVGDITEDVRYDYYRTFSELTVENFFRAMTDWCHSRGVKSRIQAHGTWGDILQAYAAADYPEGETFGEHDRYEVNTIHRRLASSAGHLYGRNVISNETFTWLRKPRFMETLEMMKAAADAVFLDGMNHIVNHGYSYSPESAGKPGWAFYASSFISHNNTWWEYYPELSRYIHTVSSFLQQGSSYAETAVYLPQADIWSSMPMAELHMAMKLEEQIGRAFVDRLQKSGYYFDYVNDEAIERLAVMNAEGMNVGVNRYKAIILPYVNRLAMPVADKLAEFVEAGGILISLGFPPSLGCGLLDKETKRQHVERKMKRIFGDMDGKGNGNGGVDGHGGEHWNRYGQGKAAIASDETAVFALLSEALEPVVRIDCCETGDLNDASYDSRGRNEQTRLHDQPVTDVPGHKCDPRDVISYVHRKHDKDDIYFVSNVSPEPYTVQLTFKHKSAHMLVIDPMCRKLAASQTSASRSISTSDKVTVTFEPYQSYLFVFTPETINETADLSIEGSLVKAWRTVGRQDISTDWTVTIDDIGFTRNLPEVTTWERFPEARHYSGAAFYEKEVVLDIPQDAGRVRLVLERVHEVAEVYINDICAGVLWKAPRQLDITDFVRQGVNRFRIKVVNLWINHVIGPEAGQSHEEETALSDNWPYFKAAAGSITTSSLYGNKEKQAIAEPLPSGLAGRITIEFGQ